MNRFFKSATHLAINLALDAQTSQFLFLESLGFYRGYTSALERINCRVNLFSKDSFKSLKINRLDYFEQQETFRKFLHALVEKDGKAMDESIESAINIAFDRFNDKDVEDAVLPPVH